MRLPMVCILALPALAAPESKLPEPWRPVAREIFAELIQLDTTHDKGATAAAEAIARRLRAGGFADAELVLAGPEPHKQNLVVRYRGAGKAKPVLYLAHLDVVRANREDWSMDPFAFIETGGYFYGRGATDMKCDVAALVTTLLRLRKERYVPAGDVIVAFTDDEEDVGGGTNGMSWLLTHRRELVEAPLAINPDAGGGDLSRGKRAVLSLQTSEKIFAGFQLEATDRGGHSSVPHVGNPISRLAAALGRLEAYDFPIEVGETIAGYFASMARQEHGPLADDLAALGRAPVDLAAAGRVAKANDYFGALMHTTCVATEVSGGHAKNALPQLARATVNCRILPTQKPADVEATLRRIIADEKVTVTSMTDAMASPPSPLTPEVTAPLTRVMNHLFPGVRLSPTLSTGASDGRFTRAAGIPTYGVSGMFTDVDDVRAHGRDERIGVLEFYDGVEFSWRFMKELTKGR